MISRNDLILLLSELSDSGINTDAKVIEVLNSKTFPTHILKFINEKRELDVNKFYTHLRKSYNDKKSKLYINIVKEVEDVNEVLTTLAALQLQILLFSKNVNDREMFLSHCRTQEITKVLHMYYSNYDLTNCVKLLKLFRADIVAFESITGRRQ